MKTSQVLKANRRSSTPQPRPGQTRWRDENQGDWRDEKRGKPLSNFISLSLDYCLVLFDLSLHISSHLSSWFPQKFRPVMFHLFPLFSCRLVLTFILWSHLVPGSFWTHFVLWSCHLVVSLSGWWSDESRGEQFWKRSVCHPSHVHFTTEDGQENRKTVSQRGKKKILN